MRIGLAGAGRIGALHAATLRDLPEVDSLVVADPVPGRAREVADRLDVHLAEPADALFTAGLDALVVAAATDAHADLVVRAVDHGLPVFCEKPVAVDLAGTVEVLKRVQGADVP